MSTRIFAPVLAVLLALIAACGSSGGHPAATHHSAPTARQLTAKGCRMLLRWENGNASDTIQNDPVSLQIEAEAGSTKFGRDFAKWADSPPSLGSIPLADQVASDCRAAGVTGLFGGS